MALEEGAQITFKPHITCGAARNGVFDLEITKSYDCVRSPSDIGLSQETAPDTVLKDVQSNTAQKHQAIYKVM